MTRISENQSKRILIDNTIRNRTAVDRYAQEVSSGVKVALPGDSTESGTISRFRQTLSKIETYKTTIATSKSFLQFQDDVMTQMEDLILRAKEVATQAANESNSPESRFALAGEIFQIRDHVVSLANSTFQGKFVFGGADDDDQPFDQVTDYTLPATGGEEKERWQYDVDTATETGHQLTRTVNITDDLNIRVNTPGDQLFNTTIQALERLGRSLTGFTTTPAAGTPDGGGVAYTFPADFRLQTDDIRNTIDLLDTARTREIIPERVSLGARMRRLETGEALLALAKNNAEEVLNRLQNADEAESASSLVQAQNALQASYTVTARVLNLSILDFI